MSQNVPPRPGPSLLIVVFLVSDESSTTKASHFTQYMLI